MTKLPKSVHTGTSDQIFIQALFLRSCGCHRCQRKQKVQRTWIYWFGALFFSQNWKIIKKPQNPLKTAHFLTFFQSFFSLGWKTAHKTKKIIFIEVFRFLWHLWHPRERKNKAWMKIWSDVPVWHVAYCLSRDVGNYSKLGGSNFKKTMSAIIV